jgi:23S rRNA (cytidine1920-2'-O)/16S rRNA (cytidine1409-2'-O)-methyltransferase
MRLDLLLAQQFPHYSRQQIQSWIMQGKVRVNNQPIIKVGTLISVDAHIVCDTQEPKYVSRAGFKLEKALHEFNIKAEGLICLDAGISTGGFTDCLLQHGAQKVYGIDVGYGQVHEKIRHDPRVILFEHTNLREITPDVLGTLVDLVTLDLSFISVLKVMDAVVSCMKSTAQLIVLIKPQFEAGRSDVGRGGIIKDPLVHQKVTEKVTKGIESYGFQLINVIESPITGTMGNKEFLAYFIAPSASK